MHSLLVSETLASNTPARVTTLVKKSSSNSLDDIVNLCVLAATLRSLPKCVSLEANEQFSHSPQLS
jgi:hypothetical protein